MTTGQLLSSHPLPNGVILELWDRSRHAAGDRWQVAVEVRVAVPVNLATVPGDLASRLPEVNAALGAEVTFSHQEVRNFIDEKEMPGLLEKMGAELRRSLETYLGHPEFPGRFIRKKWTELQEQRRWYA